MLQKTLIAALLASSTVVAIAQTKYFIVVPAPGLVVGVSGVTPAARPAASPVSVFLTGGTLSDADVNLPYSQPLASLLNVSESYTPSDVAWSLGTGNLPPGMSLSPGGVISGTSDTLNAVGSTFQVIATYKTVSGQQAYTIKVGTAVLRATQILVGGISGSYSCALLTSGGVKCWGNNGSGQLGRNYFTSTSDIPTFVNGLTSGVKQIALSGNHNCALLLTGGVKCWGSNGSGELGDGTRTAKATPVDVVGLSSGVAEINAGSYFSCALLLGGNVKCWGSNSNGQLGDGTKTDKLTPVDVVGLSSGVTSISAGDTHGCAVVAGAAQCWGNNSNGQLGDGSTVQRLIPGAVIGLSAGVGQISLGNAHTCAVVLGAAKCWGWNTAGQLGDGTTSDRYTPTAVVGLSTGVTQISEGGFQHTCAVVLGAAKCWGWNGYGQLGDGTGTNRYTPTAVAGLSSGVTQVATAWGHTCAVVATAAKCWGVNWEGMLGDGTRVQRITPTNVLP